MNNTYENRQTMKQTHQYIFLINFNEQIARTLKCRKLKRMLNETGLFYLCRTLCNELNCSCDHSHRKV